MSERGRDALADDLGHRPSLAQRIAELAAGEELNVAQVLRRHRIVEAQVLPQGLDRRRARLVTQQRVDGIAREP